MIVFNVITLSRGRPVAVKRNVSGLARLLLISAVAVACRPSDSPPHESDAVLENADVNLDGLDAAMAKARAALAEIENRKPDPAAASADLIEGIVNEDPQLIGESLEQLSHSLPKQDRDH